MGPLVRKRPGGLKGGVGGEVVLRANGANACTGELLALAAERAQRETLHGGASGRRHEEKGRGERACDRARGERTCDMAWGERVHGVAWGRRAEGQTQCMGLTDHGEALFLWGALAWSTQRVKISQTTRTAFGRGELSRCRLRGSRDVLCGEIPTCQPNCARRSRSSGDYRRS